MTEEAYKKLKEFQKKEGELIINILDTLTEQIETKYGKDVATGFVLGLDIVYFALTKEELADAIRERDKNE